MEETQQVRLPVIFTTHTRQVHKSGPAKGNTCQQQRNQYTYIPSGVTSFNTTVYSTCNDQNGAGYSFPTKRTSYGYNQANQLTSSYDWRGATTSYAYDANGALTQKSDGVSTTGYAYNGLDKLTQVTTPTSSVNYYYDALGRRISRAEGTNTASYHHDAKSDLTDYETNAGGNLTASYQRGADGLISQTDYTGQTPVTSYDLYNPHGDTSALTNASGAVTGTYRYDSFGNPIGANTLTDGYTGKWQRDKDNSTGTIRMGAREYDPASGRFTSADPLQGTPTDPQQRNRYQYVGNDPLTRYDLSGMSWGVDDAVRWAEDRASDVAEGWRITMNDPSAYASGLGDMLHPRNAVEVVRIFSGYNQFESMVNAKSPSEAFKHGTFWATDVVGIFGVGKLATTGETCLVEATAGSSNELNISSKIIRQMEQRGWTREMINATVQRGERIDAINKATGNPATRYINPETGQSVVIDNVTGDVIHVGGPGFKYGPGSGDLP